MLLLTSGCSTDIIRLMAISDEWRGSYRFFDFMIPILINLYLTGREDGKEGKSDEIKKNGI